MHGSRARVLSSIPPDGQVLPGGEAITAAVIVHRSVVVPIVDHAIGAVEAPASRRVDPHPYAIVGVGAKEVVASFRGRKRAGKTSRIVIVFTPVPGLPFPQSLSDRVVVDRETGGSFMLMLLKYSPSIERLAPSGRQAHLETRPLMLMPRRVAPLNGVAPAISPMVRSRSWNSPWPECQAFSRMVLSTVSTTRRPPVMAQRKGSMVAVAAQFRKLPLHLCGPCTCGWWQALAG